MLDVLLDKMDVSGQSLRRLLGGILAIALHSTSQGELSAKQRATSLKSASD